MKRMLPVALWRIKNRNGWSARNGNGAVASTIATIARASGGGGFGTFFIDLHERLMHDLVNEERILPA